MDINSERLIISSINYLTFLLETGYSNSIDINIIFLSNIDFLFNNYKDALILSKIITNLPCDLLFEKIDLNKFKSYISNYTDISNWLNNCVVSSNPISKNNSVKFSCNDEFCIKPSQHIFNTNETKNKFLLIPVLKEFPFSETPKSKVYTVNINNNTNFVLSDIDIPKDSNDGDIIQINDTSNTILYINKQRNLQPNLIRCKGLYGTFLPPEAFDKIIKFGINYYNNINVEYVIIPKNYSIEYSNNAPFLKSMSFTNPGISNEDIALTLNLTEFGNSIVRFDGKLMNFKDRYFVFVY